MPSQKDTSENNTNTLVQRPRRKRANLEDGIICRENLDSLFNLSFEEILRTRQKDDFATAVRSNFVDNLGQANEGIDRADQWSGERLKKYLLYKAKIAVIDLMLSDDIQQTIRAASKGEWSPTELACRQEAALSQDPAE